MAILKVGDKAPEFSVPSGEGGTVSLKDLRGKRVVLYFYPKDDTPGCTKEACSFRDNITKLANKNAVVIGVSVDGPEAHKKFSDKYGLPFALASDAKKEVVKKYGVWKQKNMYGRKYLGTERTTFVIDEKGVIRSIFEKVKVDGHIDEVLSAL